MPPDHGAAQDWQDLPEEARRTLVSNKRDFSFELAAPIGE